MNLDKFNKLSPYEQEVIILLGQILKTLKDILRDDSE